MSRDRQLPASESTKPGKIAGQGEVVDGGLEKVSGGSSGGAGAGKVTFNPFSIIRKINIPNIN